MQAEDGAVEGVPAEWFRGYLRSQNCLAEKASIGILLRALEPGEDSPTWQQDAVNSLHCITGRLKREAVLDPDFDDDVPEFQPDEFAAVLGAAARGELRQP